MKSLYKNLREIEEKWGIEAWNDICNYFYTLYRKIEDLETSRNKWKAKAKLLELAIKDGKKPKKVRTTPS